MFVTWTQYCVTTSQCRYHSTIQAATFILDMGTIEMILEENVSVASQASVANADMMALAAKKTRNINCSQQNFQMDSVLIASLYAKLKGG